MKKFAVFALAVAMAVLSFTSCAKGEPPALEDVYDRLVEVMEEAHDINYVLFGPGLPTLDRDSAEADLNGYYAGSTLSDGTEMVALAYSPYKNVEEIKAAITRVYSTAYSQSLFESTFTGYAMSDGGNTVLPAKFEENSDGMTQNSDVGGFISGQRTYDYASMEIIDGHATRITVAIRSYASAHPGEWQDGDLDFVYENGNWYLDGPSC